MKISAKDLLHLPVVTQSGVALGRIIDCEIDIDTHAIGKYVVARYPVVDELLRRTLLIDPSQVVSVTTDKMIVYDSLLPEAQKRLGLHVA